MKTIWDSAIYAKESKSGHLPGVYNLVSRKRYPEEKNTWELASAIQHLKKLITVFNKDHPDKSTATSFAIDTVSLMVRPIVRSAVKPIESSK